MHEPGGGGGGGCVVMEGPPNAVVTHRGCIHGDPVTAHHHGTRHTGKPVERRKEHTYQGRGSKAANQLATDPRRSASAVKQAKRAHGHAQSWFMSVRYLH